MSRADDLEALTTLLANYCIRMDHGEAEEWAELFTPEGQFFAFGRSFDGHVGLRELARTSPRGVHIGSQPVFEISGDDATARQNFIFVYAESHKMRIGFYDDVCVRTDAGWRFRTRRCTFATADGPSDRP